jgi:hypothetical protein
MLNVESAIVVSKPNHCIRMFGIFFARTSDPVIRYEEKNYFSDNVSRN